MDKTPILRLKPPFQRAETCCDVPQALHLLGRPEHRAGPGRHDESAAGEFHRSMGLTNMIYDILYYIIYGVWCVICGI